jgi:hypothetical protein
LAPPKTSGIALVRGLICAVFGGAKLDIRSVFVNVNRDEFTLTGTNCRKGATAGTIAGGGGNPLDPASYSAFRVADEFQATGCKKLKFRPKLKIRLFGKTQRAKHPKLRAVLKARGKDANIRKASVALPHALFLDQASLATVCTRVQFAAENCPKRSIYGKARAFTPLLGKPLEAGHGRSPAGSGHHRPRRPHRQLPRRHPHHLRPRPGRAGEQVRDDASRGQEGPARQLHQPLCQGGQGGHPDQSPERQEEEHQAGSEDPLWGQEEGQAREEPLASCAPNSVMTLFGGAVTG